MTTANSATHVFHIPLKVLKDTIIDLLTIKEEFSDTTLKEIFFDIQNTGSTLDSVFVPLRGESAEQSLFGIQYFKKSGTNNDIYVHTYNKVWISRVYYKDKNPLKYRAEFILKLQPLDNAHTKLSVLTLDPVVIEEIPNGASRKSQAEPTSVEEYTILLYIASKLGDHTLEKLKFPQQH